MSTFVQKQNKKTRGFTLVELIVVISILVILAAIIIPVTSGYIQDAKEASAKTTCRACVTAVNTIIAKRYAETGDVGAIYHEDVAELIGLKNGRVYGITLDKPYYKSSEANDKSYSLVCLTYRADDGTTCTYTTDRTPPGNNNKQGTNPRYVMGVTSSWKKGDYYYEGDILIEGGFMLRCMKEHKSGSRSNTRNPTVKSNKGTWEVIAGANGETPAYNATVRFAEGCIVSFNGNLYARTNYNLTGGQMPYSKSDSRYWDLLGPA